jgi:Protein SET DOMAIN GROUP 2 C-terminal
VILPLCPRPGASNLTHLANENRAYSGWRHGLSRAQECVPHLCRYRSGFMWGALASWHRPQGDPLVHLGNERRGCLSLPDADCCYLPVRPDRRPNTLKLKHVLPCGVLR